MATEPTTNEHPLDVKIAEARADEAYLSRNHPRHTESVANVARLFSQRYPESVAVEQPPAPLDAAREDVQPGLPSTSEAHKHLWEDADIGELQRLAGVNVSLPSGVEWHPNHGANFLSWVIAESVPAQVA